MINFIIKLQQRGLRLFLRLSLIAIFLCLISFSHFFLNLVKSNLTKIVFSQTGIKDRDV